MTYANTIVLSKINEYGLTILVNNVCVIELVRLNSHKINFKIYVYIYLIVIHIEVLQPCGYRFIL